MKAKITVLFFVVVLGGCTVQPLPIVGADGKQGYILNCNSGKEKCYLNATEKCPNGYDVVDYTKTSSILVPHYGEYPITINVERLTINCK